MFNIGNWAIKKTIRVQLGRLGTAAAAGNNNLIEVQTSISADVVSKLADIFVSDHDLLKITLDEYFAGAAGCADEAYDKIMAVATAKHGGLAVMKAAGIYC